jgi:hypothetical protein
MASAIEAVERRMADADWRLLDVFRMYGKARSSVRMTPLGLRGSGSLQEDAEVAENFFCS